jgi:hypothetical protein
MKIYLKNCIVGDVMKKIADIDKYYSRCKHSFEIFSEEGMYQVTGNKIYKLKIVDEKITVVKRSDDIELIVDKSIVTSVEAHRLPAHHIMIPSTMFIYQLKPNGVKLIIEGSYNTIHSSVDKYAGFLPYNFYFEVNSEIDDLNVFLSLLK